MMHDTLPVSIFPWEESGVFLTFCLVISVVFPLFSPWFFRGVVLPARRSGRISHRKMVWFLDGWLALHVCLSFFSVVVVFFFGVEILLPYLFELPSLWESLDDVLTPRLFLAWFLALFLPLLVFKYSGLSSIRDISQLLAEEVTRKSSRS